MEELKIRIENHKAVEDQLAALGAKFKEERRVVDTYFKQPEGKVLKISEDGNDVFLIQLRAADGKFEIVKHEVVRNPERAHKELSRVFPVKKELSKRRRLFDYEKHSISLEIIPEVGEFLIVSGEQVEPELITEQLGFKEPEFITVPFDEL